jgi:hypothetical protein
MLIQDPLPKITHSQFVSILTGLPETVYSAKFPGLRDAMNDIENNAKKSDTDKSLDDKRIKKLHEYFNRTVDNKKPLLNELHKVYNAWVTEQNSLSKTMQMLRHNGYDKKYKKSFNEAEKVLSDLDEYLKLVTGEDSSDDAAADSDKAAAAGEDSSDDAAADSDKAAARESLGWSDNGDSDELDPVHVIGTVVPRNAQPRNIITVPGRVVAASSAASLITRAGRKLRTRKSKIQHKKSNKKKSNKKKSKTHRKKHHKKTHRKY